MNEIIIITESAAVKIADIIAEQNTPGLKLRTFVQGGGCSGFQYGFSLDEEQNEDDFVVEKNGISILIDSMSMQYLQGSEIDYHEDITGSGFSIKNPNAQTTCGCGSSFQI